MAEKNKERLKEITDSIEQGIKDLFQSDQYIQYLRTMSRFHRYSVNNTVLIYMQKPDATLVAGFNKWRGQFSRNVMRGEKGIKIIAPTPYKKKIEEEKLDPETKTPVLDADGKVVMEVKEIRIPRYKVVSVFDVSQTEGKPLPQLAKNLTGDVKQYGIFLEALRRSSPVPLNFEAMNPNTDGYFSQKDQRIAIREGMSEVQTVSAAVHEITHAKLHNYEQARLAAARGDETAEPPKSENRHTEEVEAESVSYAVCQYYGIQTGENSFGYIASWSRNKELPELKASLETINRTASGLISDIDRNFVEIAKERGIDLSRPEQAAEQAAPPKAADMLPDAPEQALDKYPMPDSKLTVADLEACGYLDGDLLPLSKDRARELFEQDLTVYRIEDGGNAGMVLDTDEIQTHNGMFAVSREEWEDSRDFAAALEDRMKHQEQREAAFLKTSQDAFAIYQVKDGDKLRDIRFEPMSELESRGISVDHGNYDLAYTAPLTGQGSTEERLESLWQRFNNDLPPDYRRPSLSVSDIVALKQNGVVSCHYADSFGFKELPSFLPPENHLKNAEMAMEDDYDMIDGIIDNGKNPTVAELEQQAKYGQPVSLIELAEASRREHDEKKKSVVEQLRNQPVSREHKKAAPDRGAEMER
ncbi:MAG: YodL domain-containing protein [Oscillospiraceae bacterium]|jgi:antirestriction protein ArdC|nr:YodL domain-containing protein [Oscillospiraceae bacterium]MCI1991455.1 YodL domain-containing protein [Oscillospiraceae bacterium]MCI2035376.1 YodL domain-containing protein [Oscillospiraceae bacterium]